MTKIASILRNPLDINETDKKESPNQSTKQTDDKEVTIDNDEVSETIAQTQNAEFRSRLEAAGKLILKLKHQQEEQDKRYQELVEQTNQKINALQADNNKLQADKKDLQKQLVDEDARAARVAATDILQEATKLKQNIITNAKSKADKYHDQTLMQAEAQAHKIKNDADKYVKQAQTRTNQLNNDYVDVKKKISELSESLQDILEHSEDIHQQTVAKPVTEKKNDETNSFTKGTAVSKQTNVNKQKQQTQQLNNDKSRSTLSTGQSGNKAKQMRPTIVKHQSLFNEQDDETKSNAATMANFDNILAQVEADSAGTDNG